MQNHAFLYILFQILFNHFVFYGFNNETKFKNMCGIIKLFNCLKYLFAC